MLPDEVGVGAGKSNESSDKYEGENFTWVVASLGDNRYSLAAGRPSDHSYWGFLLDEEELVGLQTLITGALGHG